jgi:hypothetical protein
MTDSEPALEKPATSTAALEGRRPRFFSSRNRGAVVGEFVSYWSHKVTSAFTRPESVASSRIMRIGHFGARSVGAILTLVVSPIVLSIACATSSNNVPGGGFGNGETSGSNGGGISNGNTGGFTLGGASGGSAAGDARAPRCNAAGMCQCFNVAMIGHGGVTGAQAGSGGVDNTDVFTAFLNANSSALVDQFTTRASFTLNSDFLGKYDVIIVQWLADGRTAASTGGFDGQNYWTFSSDELSAVKTWVQNGGGMIFLSGYDANAAGETGATNPLLGAVSDMSYNTDDVLGAVETGNGALCLGDSEPLAGWSTNTAGSLGGGITYVGAFHGHSIKTGPNAQIDNQDPATDAVYAAHENVGNGGVYAYCDEWVTYSSQWSPSVEPATYCLQDAGLPPPSDPTSKLASACTGAQSCPAVQAAYQTAQFWANALGYGSRATMCPVQVAGVTPR